MSLNVLINQCMKNPHKKSMPMSEILREDGSVRETLLPSSLVQISSLLF